MGMWLGQAVLATWVNSSMRMRSIRTLTFQNLYKREPVLLCLHMCHIVGGDKYMPNKMSNWKPECSSVDWTLFYLLPPRGHPNDSSWFFLAGIVLFSNVFWKLFPRQCFSTESYLCPDYWKSVNISANFCASYLYFLQPHHHANMPLAFQHAFVQN